MQIHLAQQIEQAIGSFNSTLEPRALEYLKRRNITDQSIKDWEIGYGSTLVAAYTQSCSRRLLFPIRNAYGKLVSITARIIPPDVSDRKYTHLPHTPIRSLLYGLHRAKQNIYKTGFAILVEGPMDTISLHQQGLNMALGLFGSHVHTEVIPLLLRYTTTALVYLDKDQIPNPPMTIWGLTLHPLILDLPGDDPAEQSQHPDFVLQMNKQLEQLQLL